MLLKVNSKYRFYYSITTIYLINYYILSMYINAYLYRYRQILRTKSLIILIFSVPNINSGVFRGT